MNFAVRDLMTDVLPLTMANGCGPRTTTPQPEPCPAPSCAKNSARAAEETEEPSAVLPALAVLREQLRQALRP